MTVNNHSTQAKTDLNYPIQQLRTTNADSNNRSLFGCKGGKTELERQTTVTIPQACFQ